MTTNVATNHRGLSHDTAFYDSDEELLSLAVPFLTAGAQAREPTVAVFEAGKADLIHAALGGDTDGISWIDATAHYVRPTTTIKSYRTLLAEYVAQGAQQVRVIAEVPTNSGLPWDWWARYEAAFNHLFAAVPLWVICPYDTRTCPTRVLADVARTHPHVVGPDGERITNACYQDPRAFLTRSPAAGADPLEATPPLVDLAHATPPAARRAVEAAAAASLLDHRQITSMVFAVNEAVTNGLYHGLPPVRLRLWPGADRLVATVTDHGPGPPNPYVGLLPPTDLTSHLGLFLLYQTCSHVTFGTDDNGFTVRLVVGAPGTTP